MEVISGVASVISIVTLALQSTKVIYEVGSSINHGSDEIDRLVRATGNLEKLLEVIRRLALHAESTNSVAEGKLLEELEQPVGHCASALGDISVKLVKLQKGSKDGRWEKAKKYARVYLDTKGISEIWNTINHCVELLGSCLGNASVDVGLYNAQEVQVVHDEISAASSDNKASFLQIEEILRDQRVLAQVGLDAFRAEFHQESLDARVAATTQIQGIADIKTEQQHFGEVITVGHERMADIQADVQNLRATVYDRSHQASLQSEAFMTDVQSGISEISNSASGQLEAVGRMNIEVMEKLRSIGDRLEAVPSMASEQLSILHNLVGMISDMQLERRSGRQEEQNTIRDKANLAEIDPSRDLITIDYPEIEKIMRRIGHFARTMTTLRPSKNAQSVIEDVGRLLGLVKQYSGATSMSRNELPRKRKTLCDYHYSELETEVQTGEDLAKAKRVLTASERVRIYNKDKEDCDTESADEAFAAKLVVTPTTTTLSNVQIIIDLASKTYQNRTVHFTPTLTFRAMIPDDSEVFRVVQRGSVKKLKKLLSSGAASLGDCDPEGRSLLNYALHRHRRKMTAFLIQSGADIDTLEIQNFGHDLTESWMRIPVKPISLLTGLDSTTADEDLERAEGCYKLLLDADSDITSIAPQSLGDGTYWANAYSIALLESSFVKLKALIDIGEPFISLESTGDSTPMGPTPLHVLAHCHYMGWWEKCQVPDKIALLLSRGANVNARNHRGQTSLHIVFQHFTRDERCGRYDVEARRQLYLSESIDILVLMCSAGADVCAIDDLGRSVSDAAFDSAQEVAWIKALKYCGIDINDVLARPNVDPAGSTALSSPYNKRPKSVTSKLSLAEYLKRRKPCARGQPWRAYYGEISSSEDDDSEDEDHEDDESEYGDWDDECDNEDYNDDDESENEDSAEDTNESSNGREADCIPENGQSDFTYENDIAGEKAKLD